MTDIMDVTMEEFYVPEGSIKGYAVLPKIETKEVVIPSPPTTTIVPINPRKCVIYLAEEAVTPESCRVEALKAYAKENNYVMLCPEIAAADDLMEVYEWVFAPDVSKRMNLKKGVIAVMADETLLELAEELTELLEDEEIEPDDAEVLVL